MAGLLLALLVILVGPHQSLSPETGCALRKAKPAYSHTKSSETTKGNEMSEWIAVENEAPTGCVLAACFTSDCGWVIDSVWLDDDRQWYATGPIGVHRCHLPYSHWMPLPAPPSNKT